MLIIFKYAGAGLLALSLLLSFSCAHPTGIGIGGRYLDGKMELIRRSNGDLTKAVDLLESVVMEDPLYKDSLTLLARAYYQKGRYRDAMQVAQRSLSINSKDEIAWITQGLIQLRLGDNDNGLESLKGGLTLLSQVSKSGYRDIEAWDPKRSVRNALSRTVFVTLKGVYHKDDIIGSAEQLLVIIDNEEWMGAADQALDRRS